MLEVKDLAVEFKIEDRLLRAVDGVSFCVGDQKMVGLVGESGSGKSVTALSVLNLLSGNGRIIGGEIVWNGRRLAGLSPAQWREIRGREMAMIFQNPLAALNPVFSIGDQLVETIRWHHHVSQAEALTRAIDLLKAVQINDAHLRVRDYPHQFSLGMCQRIMIALTLSMNPKLIIADEPTASLDVTVQAQILELLERIKDEFKMSVLLISHDLGVVAQHCEEMMVMYLGKIAEVGATRAVFAQPRHPYTHALLASIAVPDPARPRGRALRGEVPSLASIGPGCRFASRCPHVMDRCRREPPPFYIDPATGQEFTCFLAEDAGLPRA
jgi:oligopeptide/dipeptide ABC transporter ATP-binding protein